MNICYDRLEEDELKRLSPLFLQWRDKIELASIMDSYESDKKIVLFGAGGVGEYISQILIEAGYKIDYFVDNKLAAADCAVNNIPVRPVSNLLKDVDCVNVYITINGIQSAVKQLISMGMEKHLKGCFHWFYNRQMEKKYTDSIRIDSTGRLVLPSITCSVIGKCNLRCKYCSMASPFRNDLEPSKRFVQSHLNWQKKIKPQKIEICGGEPLLHPDIDKILRQACNIWTDSKIIIQTNGLLADKISEQLLLFLKDHNVSFMISKHIDNDQSNSKIEQLVRLLQKEKMDYSLRQSHLDWWKSMCTNAQYVPTTADVSPQTGWNECLSKVTCNILYGNHFCKCRGPYMMKELHKQNVLLLNEKQLKTMEDEIMDINSSPQELLEHIKSGPMKTCGFCPIGKDFEYVKAEQMKNG